MKIVVFGDSVLKGVVTGPETKGIFDITPNDSLTLAQKVLGFELDNHSIYGNIITKAQGKFQKWLEKGNTADICIIEFGDNDSDYDWPPISKKPDGQYQPKTPLKDFLQILDQMVTECKNQGILPVLVNAPALVPDRWFNTISKNLNRENILKFIFQNITQLYRNQEIYNAHVVKYAYENRIDFIDMRLSLLELPNYDDYICQDGIHPNDKGYQKMSEIWIKNLPAIFEKVKKSGDFFGGDFCRGTGDSLRGVKNSPLGADASVSEEKRKLESDKGTESSSAENSEITIYTDGGCSGNPGSGGWGIVVIADGLAKQLSGGEKNTTNNRMELTAAITALTVIHNTPAFANRHVTINIDSQYVKNGITSWIKGWKAKGWKTAGGQPVKNQDLWEELNALNDGLNVSWNWVKGHAGVEYNEICDQLCKAEMAKFK